ncbi:MAG: serine/threonine protein kinase, partial [Planctomycetota bacterium]|nr:serine/threonine protein kinase [Planctomycetota bacterium]
LVMEYLEGKTVEQLVDEKGPLNEDEALRLVSQVSDALQYAHERNIAHRDIKPSNIIVDCDGCARLCDFGLAKPIGGAEDITLSGLIMGTPEYLSPEQAHGRVDIDIRSDIYSLGATLYHMLVGRPPFEGKSPQETAARHITDEVKFPPEANITPATRSLILWMMRKLREERPETPKVVKEAIHKILSGQTHSALAGTTVAILLKMLKRRLRQFLDSRLALTVAAVIIAGFLVILGLLLRK